MKANRYPWWKNALVAGVLAVAALYALPNLYPSEPSVQISSSRAALGEAERGRVEQLLKLRGLEPRRLELSGESLLARFADPDRQLRAADALRGAFGDRYTVALNLAPSTPDWLAALRASPMHLGLDLRGGVHFLLEVDLDASIAKAYERYAGDVRTLLREEQIRYRGVRAVGEALYVRAADAAQRDAVRDALADEYFDALELEAGEHEGRPAVVARLNPATRRSLRQNAISQNLVTLRKRVNELGVAEPSIQQQGKTRIAVQLPGVQDTARAKEILGATATLEFRLVDDQADPYLAAETGQVPLASRLYRERDGAPVLLKRQVMLTGEHIVDAASGFDEHGRPAVHITLDGDGARQFARVTGENVKRPMGVVFIEQRADLVTGADGERRRVRREVREVINVATIQEQLSKRFQITGLDSPREARNLALLLRAGSLATPMHIVEERTVGPSLGQRNIELGALSVLVGFLLVMAFMLLYYRLFGLLANLALVANLVLIVAVMSMIPGATLTLPGIAGIVLTVGMAVDANVLIFERIREELRNGNSPQSSIQAGYSKALSTIADANLTTLIAAVVLFAFGTGPIKGFAVTLSIGIVASMFTAIMGTRAAVNLLYGRRQAPRLAI